MLLGGHYRQPLNFAFDALAAARTALARIDEFTVRMEGLAGNAQCAMHNAQCGVATPSPDGQAPSWPEKHLSAFSDALADDLNSPLAFAAVFALVNEGNRLAQAGSLDAAGAAAALAALARMDTVLGVLARPAAAIPAEVQALLDERAAARQAKNWAESDRLRDAIAALGWAVKDTKDGQRLSKS